MARTGLLYHVLNNSGGYLKELRGVIGEPQWTAEINGGLSALSLSLDHFPAELTWGNLIQVMDASGNELGRWKYEEDASGHDTTNKWTLTLVSLVSEMQDTKDFNANYTSDTTQGTPALGAVEPATATNAALAKTAHLAAGRILNVGKAESYNYVDAAVQDAVDQHVKFGGSGWWWFCDGTGRVDVANTPNYTHSVTAGREATVGALTRDIHTLINAQTVEGATPQGATAPLSATAADTNAANALSVPNLGRRSGQVYKDQNLADQTAVNDMATNLLAMGERVNIKRTIRLIDYTGQRPRPGDAITIRTADPNIGARSMVVLGPYLVMQVGYHGATLNFDLTVTDVAARVKDQSQYNRDWSVSMMIRRMPPQGYVPGVTPVPVNTLTGAPNTPTGLAGTAYLEATGQVENAAFHLSWAAPATDATHLAPTTYAVQYKRSSASTWQQLGNAGGTSLDVTGLVQGVGYDFQVKAGNAAGYSAWTATTTITSAIAGSPSGAPASFTGVAGVTTAQLQWNLLSDADIDYYEVWQYTGNSGASAPPTGSILAWNGQAALAAITGLTSNQIYSFWVRAKNKSGIYGVWTAALQLTPRYVQNGDIAAASIIVDKLAAGTLSAAVILSGNIRTAATVDGTHAGVLVDGTSIRASDGSGTNYGAPSGAGITLEFGNTGAGYFSGTILAKSIITGGIQSAAGSNIPTIPVNFTGYQLDATNGLRFYKTGTLTAQFAIDGTITVYNATIYSSTFATSTSVGSGSGGTGLRISPTASGTDIAGLNLYSSAYAVIAQVNTWNGTTWVPSLQIGSTYVNSTVQTLLTNPGGGGVYIGGTGPASVAALIAGQVSTSGVTQYGWNDWFTAANISIPGGTTQNFFKHRYLDDTVTGYRADAFTYDGSHEWVYFNARQNAASGVVVATQATWRQRFSTAPTGSTTVTLASANATGFSVDQLNNFGAQISYSTTAANDTYWLGWVATSGGR